MNTPTLIERLGNMTAMKVTFEEDGTMRVGGNDASTIEVSNRLHEELAAADAIDTRVTAMQEHRENMRDHLIEISGLADSLDTNCPEFAANLRQYVSNMNTVFDDFDTKLAAFKAARSV